MRRHAPPPTVRERAASALAMGLLLSAAFSLQAAHAEAIGRAEELALSHSIGRVEARLDDGRVGVGSAITVAQGILVTNCHVTGRAVSVKVIGGGMPWTASEQVADVVHDICF